MGKKRRAELIEEYENLCARLWDVENTEEYWDDAVESILLFERKYPESKSICMALLESLEEKGKLLKACAGQLVKDSGEEVLTPAYKKILSNCYEMLAQRRKDPMIRKIYSDVNFYRLIGKIEEYEENLRIAETLFPT